MAPQILAELVEGEHGGVTQQILAELVESVVLLAQQTLAELVERV